MPLWVASEIAADEAGNTISRQLAYTLMIDIHDVVDVLGKLCLRFIVNEDVESAEHARSFLSVSIPRILVGEEKVLTGNELPTLFAENYSQILDICRLALECAFDTERWLESHIDRLLLFFSNEITAFLVSHRIEGLEGLFDDVD